MLDRAERDAGAALSMLVTVVTAAALIAGGALVAKGTSGPAIAAIGVFVALALAETLLALRRGVAELGKMGGAAQRIGDDAPPASRTTTAPDPRGAPLLRIDTPALMIAHDANTAIALTGPSGSGKTTLLMQIAGLANGDCVTLLGRRPDHWPDAALRDVVAMVPQRSALIAGTIRDNLTLAADADDAALWNALRAVALDDTIAERGGLDARLSEGGAGLSGGQARRLALARAILKAPRLLLLDEPTEGLDAAMARRVLSGIRTALPDAAILAALHRGADHPMFDGHVHIGAQG
jgi:ATP-binding cassette subfamily C protein CydC